MHPHPASQACLLYCRPGMEGDCAAEIIDRAAALGIHGWCRPRDGAVEFHPPEADGIAALAGNLDFTRLVFARQWCALLARVDRMPAADRVAPLVAAIADPVSRFSELRVEHPDSTDGRPLARLSRALHAPLLDGLRRAGAAQAPGAPVVHVFLTPGQQALIGLSDPANASPWHGGIPRLRVPRGAPSRSARKLEEALTTFLDDDERAAWLRPGRRAVDLGAAPGGWSWLLLERGLRVEAVDNAALADDVVGHPRLTHHRVDGFAFRPPGRNDWLVCDMVERPHRIARLATDWLQRRDARHVIVNLKLPMKQRWPAIREHAAAIAAALPRQGRWAAKQLYHDRDEVTLFATRAPLQRRRT